MRATLEAHLSSRAVARIVYGSIIGLALIVTLENHPPGAGVVTAWLLGTAVSVALAEIYSEIVGAETRQRHRVTRHQVVLMIDEAVAVGFGVAFPAVFFLLSWLGLFELSTAFRIARWSGLGLIAFYGYWAARFAGAPVPRALLQAAAVAATGAVIIVLKALVH